MKISILSLALSFFWIPVSAQKFIPRAGLSLSTIKYEEANRDYFEESWRSGFVIGAAVDLPVLKRLSFQPELCFVKKGAHQQYEAGYILIKSVYNLNYLELSLLAKVGFGGFYVIGGPTYGYGLGGTYIANKWTEIPNGPPPTFESEEKDVEFGSNTTWDLNEFDEPLEAGAVLGIGYVLKGIQLDFRYVVGLTSFDANAFVEYTKAKNRVLQMTIGYPFSIRKKNKD